MSIFGALRSGVSGLFAQSQSLATTADNIANVNTTGYKVNRIQFNTLVTNSASPTLFSSGGVQSRVARDNDIQGLLAASASATDVAITGQGFFTVTDEVTFNETTGEFEPTGNIFFTRAGEFRPDQDGNLVNAGGFFLTGWPRNAADTGFEVTTVPNAFSAVNTSAAAAVATPTTEVEIGANLPAASATGDSFDVALQVFNRQGGQRTLTVTFTRNSAVDTWDVTAELVGGGQFVDIDVNDDGTTQSGLFDTNGDGLLDDDERAAVPDVGAAGSNASYAAADIDLEALVGTRAIASLGQVTFNADGSIASTTFDSTAGNVAFGDATTSDMNFLIDFDANSATDDDLVPITLNLGTIGGTDLLTQFDGANVINALDQNGRQFGSLTGVTISDDGIVTALFDNGVTREIFQIPVTTFANPNALTPLSGNVFIQTDASGQAVPRVAGTGGSGAISPSSLEQSTVDIADEFTKLIITQRAFSANTRTITTADELLDELIRTIR